MSILSILISWNENNNFSYYLLSVYYVPDICEALITLLNPYNKLYEAGFVFPISEEADVQSYRDIKLFPKDRIFNVKGSHCLIPTPCFSNYDATVL